MEQDKEIILQLRRALIMSNTCLASICDHMDIDGSTQMRIKIDDDVKCETTVAEILQKGADALRSSSHLSA